MTNTIDVVSSDRQLAMNNRFVFTEALLIKTHRHPHRVQATSQRFHQDVV
jgi:hypothetical protein